MRIFLTGATGFIGSRILTELQAAGHQVIGLARFDASAAALTAAGAEVQPGTLDSPETLLAAVSAADAVIHTAFDHDFSRFVANCEKDHRVILAIGNALAGRHCPLIITSGTAMGDADDGEPASELNFNPAHPNPRVASELAGNQLLDAGVDVRVVRLPQVHDTVRQGLLTYYIQQAAEKGVAAIVGEGNNCWSAGHINDVARLYLRVLERGEKGRRYHAVDEEAVPSRLIANVVAEKLGIPLKSLSAEQSVAHFGWFAAFANMDLRATSALTRQQLDWLPRGPTLLDDLNNMDYRGVTTSR